MGRRKDLNHPVNVNPRLYRIYKGLKERCEKDWAISYPRYGGRGIRNEWKSVHDFFNDMLSSYLEHVSLHGERNTSIDRIDGNGNYSKENCRWATSIEQCVNRNTSKVIKHNGITKTIPEWAREYGVSPAELWRRAIKRGMPFERALIKGNLKTKKYRV